MAIKPQTLEASFTKECIDLEAAIDSMLVGQTITRGEKLNISAPRGFTLKHLPLLKEMYQQAGWSNIEFHSGPRDGDYLIFIY